jgi:hypothetical protein
MRVMSARIRKKALRKLVLFVFTKVTMNLTVSLEGSLVRSAKALDIIQQIVENSFYKKIYQTHLI